MKKHRKLFPINGTTTDCPAFCDVPLGEFYYPQPPPPPSPSTNAISDDESSHSVSPSVVVLLVLLASFLLLLLYYVVVSKSCLGLFRRRRRDTYDDEDLGEASGRSGGGGERDQFVDHHQNPIWLIATVGLQQPIINSITVVRYRKGEGLIDGSDCSVCLSEFREGETLRLLPKCSHAFHVPCIDTWLRSHTNCPLCRAHIVVVETNHHQHNNAASGGNSDISAAQNAVVERGEAANYYSDQAAEENGVVRSALRRSASTGNCGGG